MRVSRVANKILGTTLVCLLMASALGNLPGTVNAAKLGADYRRPARTLASPAGQGKIAFTRSVEGRYEIDVINPDGSERMVLSQNGNGPEWSPDGTKIAFVSQREHSQDIYIMNADGTGEVRITYSSDWDWGPLAWSPSGTKIAFARTPPFFTENPDVWVMNADGSREIQLTTDPSDDWQPSWSPDGTKIAFVSQREGGADIWVMNADGSGQTNLIEDPDWEYYDEDPAWSPDGSKIAFVSSREGEIDRSIYVMNTDGSNITRLTTSTGDNAHPSWSPDGTRIAFASNRDGNYDIYIMNADGTNETRVTYDPANESGPSWGIAADTGVIEECLVTITDDPEADPATVESNRSAQLSVSVTDSLDHDIYYSWTATGGSFDNDESQNPTWYAPVNTSSSTVYYTLSVTARCSQGTTASGSVQVGVRAEEAAPAVSTYDASDVDLTSATLNGYLESTGGLDCLVWFEYGTSISYERSTSRVSQSSEGPFSASISDLDPDTAYHFRACASNSEGTSYGSDVIFTQLTEEVRVGIDSCNVSPKELRLGEDSTLSFSFTNTGDTPWTFYAAVSLRQPNGAEVHLPLQPVALDPNQQGSAAWSYTINYEGGWDVVFGIWKEQEQENSLGHTSWLNDYIICVQDDTNAPRVEFLSTQPGSITLGDSFTISYTVSDLGGSALNRVELWRANDSNGNPADWVEITRNSASGNSDSGFFTDAPPSAGFYWYGIHAVDNAGNWAPEASPVQIEVIPEFRLESVPTEYTGGVIIPREVFPEGKGAFIPLYVPGVRSGSNAIEPDNDWKTVKEIEKTKVEFDWWKLATYDPLAAGTQGPAAAAVVGGYALFQALDKVPSTLKIKITLQEHSSGNLRAIIQVGDPNGKTFARDYAGKALFFSAFWTAEAALSESIAKAFSLQPDNYPLSYYSMALRLDRYHREDEYVAFISLSEASTIVLTPKIYPEDELRIVRIKNVFDVDTIIGLSGNGFVSLTKSSLDEPTSKTILRMLAPGALVTESGLIVQVKSPVELRVYDSRGRVTGLAAGEVKEEIPHSLYDSESKTVVILSPSDSYRYEAVGTSEGTYKLEITSTKEGETSIFTLKDVPTSTKVVHEYTIDWENLAKGEKGVTMKVDSDGDGTFEETRKLGSLGTSFSWIWIIVAGVSGLIGVFVGAFMVWRRTGNKQAA